MIIDTADKDNYYYGVPTFNFTDDINYILNHHLIGQVWIVSSVQTQPSLEKTINKFLNYSIDCRLVLPESKYKFTEGLDSDSGFDFYNISFSPFYGSNLLIKNLLDKILSLFFLILSFPLILVASILIFLNDGFPLFFSQKRTGWDGKSFYIYKFRTLSKTIDSSPTKQVEAGDKRVTKVGSLLRRFSIDELPQFLNVLKGDMSIVGPRPHMIEHTKYYSEEILNFMQRHKCPPGLTGWAQINGFRGPTQNKELMDKRFQFDLYYIKNWNLVLDFYIIIRIIFVILFQKVD
jgi:putative colanic acid biosynthesis UDP-glucose lipid carrier transferase